MTRTTMKKPILTTELSLKDRVQSLGLHGILSEWERHSEEPWLRNLVEYRPQPPISRIRVLFEPHEGSPVLHRGATQSQRLDRVAMRCVLPRPPKGVERSVREQPGQEVQVPVMVGSRQQRGAPVQ